MMRSVCLNLKMAHWHSICTGHKCEVSGLLQYFNVAILVLMWLTPIDDQMDSYIGPESVIINLSFTIINSVKYLNILLNCFFARYLILHFSMKKCDEINLLEIDLNLSYYVNVLGFS